MLIILHFADPLNTILMLNVKLRQMLAYSI